MLFVLAGPSYVGKKTAMNHFMKLYSFSSIIPYTTKPEKRRGGEVEGIKYHYVETCNKSDIENDDYIYDRPFEYKTQKDDVLYAYKKSDLEQAINGYSNFIIHASAWNAIQIRNFYCGKNAGDLYIIFLDYAEDFTEANFKKRFTKADGGINIDNVGQNYIINEADLERRYIHALKEKETYKQNKEKFDTCIKGAHPYDICEELQKYILPRLFVMPSSPDRIPGPLGDDDIVYMCEKRKDKDKLMLKKDGRSISGSELRSMLCGCGLQFSLSSTIRRIKSVDIRKYIDMAEDECNIEKQMFKCYTEENISTGYVLSPYEVILCSSAESIYIPGDVYAIVSSRFSYTQLGLSINLGTSVIQAGHSGRIHFQMQNNTPNSICIYPGIQPIQLLFFRTVHHISKEYSDSERSHAYDKNDISPKSEFYKNNEALRKVKKPRANWLKNLIKGLGNKFLGRLTGMILSLPVLLNFIRWAKTFFGTELLSFFQSFPSMEFVIGISVVVFVLNLLFDAVGQILYVIIGKIRDFIVKKTR